MLQRSTRIADGIHSRLAPVTEEQVAGIVSRLDAPFGHVSVVCPRGAERDCPPDAVVPVVNTKPTDEERWCEAQVSRRYPVHQDCSSCISLCLDVLTSQPAL